MSSDLPTMSGGECPISHGLVKNGESVLIALFPMAIFKRFEVWLLLFLIAGAVGFVMQPAEDEDEAGEVAEKEGVKEEKVIENPKEADPKVPESEGVKTTGNKAVAKSEEKPSPPETPGVAKTTSAGRFEIQKAAVVSENGGSVVEIEVLGNGEGKVELSEANAQLLTDAGDRLDRFFLPFDPPPVLDGEESIAALKYWVKGELNPDDKFWLEIDGDRIAVDLEKR